MKRSFCILLFVFFSLSSCAYRMPDPDEFSLCREYPGEMYISVHTKDIDFEAECALNAEDEGVLTFTSPESLSGLMLSFDEDGAVLQNEGIVARADLPQWLCVLLYRADDGGVCRIERESGMELYCVQSGDVLQYFEKNSRDPVCFEDQKNSVRIDFVKS